MKIKQFTWDIVDSNSWLIIDGNSGVLIDAVENTELYKCIGELEKLLLIITHAHFDHIYGLNHIRKLNTKTKVISTSLCSEYLGNIYKNMSATANIFLAFYKNGENSDKDIEAFRCESSDILISKKESILWNGHSISLIPVYGHSEDGLMVVLDNKYLFSGDTLLHTPTITRFPSGSTKKFWKEDMQLLNKIKDIITVYPGHGNPGDMSNMMSKNKRPEKYKTD